MTHPRKPAAPALEGPDNEDTLTDEFLDLPDDLGDVDDPLSHLEGLLDDEDELEPFDDEVTQPMDDPILFGESSGSFHIEDFTAADLDTLSDTDLDVVGANLLEPLDREPIVLPWSLTVELVAEGRQVPAILDPARAISVWVGGQTATALVRVGSLGLEVSFTATPGDELMILGRDAISGRVLVSC